MNLRRNEEQLDDGIPTNDSFHNADDSEDEVTDFVRENLRRYSLDSNFDKCGIPFSFYTYKIYMALKPPLLGYKFDAYLGSRPSEEKKPSPLVLLLHARPQRKNQTKYFKRVSVL